MDVEDWARLFDGLSRVFSMLAGIFKRQSEDLKKKTERAALQG